MSCYLSRTVPLLLLSWMLATVAAAETAVPAADARRAVPSPQAVTAAHIPFVPNHGELADSSARFVARTFAGTVFVTGDGALVYALPVLEEGTASGSWAFRESFLGRRPGVPRGQEPGAARVHVFHGDDPAAWRTNLATYERVGLGEVYDGVRVSLRASGRSVEKLFHVEPGGDASSIEIAVDGVDGVAVDGDGRLVLSTSRGDVVFSAPVAYQTDDDARQPVRVAYAVGDGNRYGFRIGDYDRSRELVIDPLLAATYLGGHNPSPPGNYDDDWILGMAVDGDEVVVAGVTQSPDFPLHLGYDHTLGSASPEGFVTRMSGDLSTVIASTYIGTDGFDRVTDIALDSDGTVVAVGQASHGFPVTPGAYTWSGGTPTGGGFVTRFSADLSSLVASAVVTPGDYPDSVAIGNGGIYFGGTTNNPGFPITPGAYRSDCCPAGSFGIREYDGFAGKISADLTTLEAMTYLGGSVAASMAVAPGGAVYVADGFDHAVHGYLARFDPGLTARTSYLSYYPGSTSGSSRAYFNDVVAGDGYVVAVGQTYMDDLPTTPGVFDSDCGTDGQCDGVGPLLVPRSDGFVGVYSTDLQTTLALSYLGGSDHESIRAVALGGNGDIYVTGETSSVDFPTAGEGADRECGFDGRCDPDREGLPSPDGFVVRMTGDLTRLEYGTYLGGRDQDQPTVITVDDRGTVFTAGYTRSDDFPTTPGAFDETYNYGTSDAYIAKIDAGGTGAPIFADGFETADLGSWSGVVVE